MEKLNVVYACDDNYAPYACVSICSLLENNKDFDCIDIYVVVSNVSKKNIEKFQLQVKRYNANLILVDASKIISEIIRLGIPEYRGSYATNFRLFFNKYIKEDVDRFFYLDCDTIIEGSLYEISHRDMENYCAFVVQDAMTCEYKGLIGFKESDPYFNAGVMLINVKNWKKYNCSNLMIQHIKNERAAYCNPDQDLLNIVLKGKVKFVEPEYNYQPLHRMLSSKQYKKIFKNPAYYSVNDLEKASYNHKIIHAYRFLGEFPWHKDNKHPDTKAFDKYLKMSEQNDYVKKKSRVNMLMKIEKILYFFLPREVFFRLFKAVHTYNFKRMNKKLTKNK